MTNLKKTIYIFLTALIIVSVTNTSTIASGLGLSHGIMPDNPLYQIDLNVEKIQLYTQDSKEGQAKLHLAFGTERLNEMDYLAENEELEIENVINLSSQYQTNINEFSKIVSKNLDVSEKIEEITPKIEELQVIQSKVVNKINEKSTKTEVKIIVKSSIQESQSDIIEAVQNVKKPVVENINTNSSDITVTEKNKEKVKKIDETITNLSKQKEQLQVEIKIDEDSLKSEKQAITDKSNDNTNSEQPKTITTTTESTNNNENISYNNQEVFIDETIANESSAAQTSETIIETPKEWYYSPTCEYVSSTKGKDPICGEDMLAVSSLPNDHSFFMKYTYKDGKYTQNINDIIAKEELANNSEEKPAEEITAEVIVDPLVAPETNDYNDNLLESNTY